MTAQPPQQQQPPPLFGIIPAGLPVYTQPTECPSPTSFLYSIPTVKPFEHTVVFLLPGVSLPSDTAAAIYLVAPPSRPGQAIPDLKFVGGVGLGKESAIFKLNRGAVRLAQDSVVVIGISIEPAASVAQRVASVAASRPDASSALVHVGAGGGAGDARTQAPSTLVLAQRIIKNAFNFLASFSGTAGQVEVVPLKAFEDWWRKFESRVRTDPGFLERDD